MKQPKNPKKIRDQRRRCREEMVQTWEDRIAYPGGTEGDSHLHIELLASQGLAGRTGRPAPTLGSWCCRQPEVCRTGQGYMAQYQFCFSRKPLALMGSLKEHFILKNSPPSLLSPHTIPPTVVSLSWPSPCSPGSRPGLTAVPWG